MYQLLDFMTSSASQEDSSSSLEWTVKTHFINLAVKTKPRPQNHFHIRGLHAMEKVASRVISITRPLGPRNGIGTSKLYKHDFNEGQHFRGWNHKKGTPGPEAI